MNAMELEMIDVNSCSLPSDFQSGLVWSGPVWVFTKATNFRGIQFGKNA